MTIEELQKQLEEAYSQRNLNTISLTLINLHKNRQYGRLQKITEIINDYVDIKISAEGRGFTRLIMLYHPDRRDYYLSEINCLAAENDFEGLLKFSHIFRLKNIDVIAESLNSSDDMDYTPVYDWDFEADGFSIINDQETTRVKGTSEAPDEFDFLNALKIRYYSQMDVELPPHYLNDIDEFELSSSNINDLNGVQFCVHAKLIDVSDNHIFDLTPLRDLTVLEELNLSDNEVVDLDALSFIASLKRLYLSNNQIEDLSPLFDLESLEYIDLTGNNVRTEQINMLVEMGVEVDFYRL
jgi:Leucine-rich repeat (LRR) protein